MPKHYHMLIGNGEKEMQKLDKNSEEALPKLTPPFLPSFLSLAKDIGKKLRKRLIVESRCGQRGILRANHHHIPLRNVQ